MHPRRSISVSTRVLKFVDVEAVESDCEDSLAQLSDELQFTSTSSSGSSPGNSE